MVQTKDGPAAASSDIAKKAMEAVEKGPTNSTNPDKDDDHSGFGATDVGPGSNRDDPKAAEGTASLMGESGMKGSWLTQLVGESQVYLLFTDTAYHVLISASTSRSAVLEAPGVLPSSATRDTTHEGVCWAYMSADGKTTVTHVYNSLGSALYQPSHEA